VVATAVVAAAQLRLLPPLLPLQLLLQQLPLPPQGLTAVRVTATRHARRRQQRQPVRQMTRS